MKPNDPHAETVVSVGARLRSMWVRWGLAPLGAALVATVVLSLLRHESPISEPEQLALGFKGVMAAGGALFLLGFWLDGRWTDPHRIVRLIAHEADMENTPSRAVIQDHSHLAVDGLILSVKALTVIGLLIGLAGVLAAFAGLNLAYSIQILLLALAFQVFIFSRHPYYMDLAEAALRGELVADKAPGKD